MVIANQGDAKRFAFLHKPFQYRRFGRHTGAFDLRDRLVQGNCAIQRRSRADHAVAAEHAGFDELPGGQTNNKRNDARVRKIDPLDGVFGPVKHSSLRKLYQTSNEDEEVRCLAAREKPKNDWANLVEA